jgi:cell division septation protein DedD
MGNRENEQIDRYSVGLFQSLTPVSYIILTILTAGVVAGAGMLFFGGQKGELDAVTSDQASSSVQIVRPVQFQEAMEMRRELMAPETESDIRHSVPGDDPVPAADHGERGAVVSARAEPAPPRSDASDVVKGVEREPAPAPVAQAPPSVQMAQKPPAAPAPAPVAQAPPSVQMTQKPPAASAPQPVQPRGRWVVQLSANRNPDLARGWAKRLQEIGANAYVMERRTEQGTLYILRMGFFASREEARAKAEEVVSRTGLQGYSLQEAGAGEIERFAH